MKEKYNNLYVVIGTRAQLIKMAPIMKELQEEEIDYYYIYTGQHKETMDDLRQGFGLKDVDLDLSMKGFEASTILKFVLWGFKMISFTLLPWRLFKNGRGLVLTHGDTATCAWAAFVGKMARNKVAHCESGLRSFNIFHPFPEEINRLITFAFTDYYFCPNEWALDNLKKYKGKKINTQNNTLLDSVRLALSSSPKLDVEKYGDRYSVFSMHRFENIFNFEMLEFNLEMLKNISSKIKVVFVLHPSTRDVLQKKNLLEKIEKNKNIELLPRQNFIDFIHLVKNSEFIITDGGSNQEECAYMGHPCLLLRKTTERIEGLDRNVVLSKYDKEKIINFVDEYENYKYPVISEENNPSKIIVSEIKKVKV